MVWMFIGLLPACAGQLFDGEHVRCVSDGCTRWIGAAVLGEIVRIFSGSRNIALRALVAVATGMATHK